MELNNTTKLKADYTLGMAPGGREYLIVVVKGTYTIPRRPEEPPALVEEQAPLVMTDEHTGEPAFSAPRYEMEFARHKPRCDVLLNGCAHAPGGKPAPRVQVALQVSAWSKTFNVVGNRVYKAGMLYIAASEPEPFTVMPISYDNAFGGVDRSDPNPAKHRWFLPNHAGVGFHDNTSAGAIDGKPLPNTEEIGHAVTNPRGNYRPMAYGPIARAWQPRPKWAGTYDQKWRDETAPFLPADFDDRYFQSAPEDQQIDYPKGGEQVVLTNLTPQGRTAFTLPALGLPVVFFRKNGDVQEVPAVVDTIIVEPDKQRFLLVWRASLPLHRDLFEIRQAAVGKTARYWQRLADREERTSGIPRFPSLAALAAWNRQQEAEAAAEDSEAEDTETEET